MGRAATTKGFVCSIVLLALFLHRGSLLAQGPIATPSAGAVIVEWTTESEVNHAGFNVYRSENPDGPYVKLNDTLVPASGDPIAGGSYVYTDATARPGVTYYYKLEDVELHGTTSMHGPIEVAIEAEAIPGGFDVAIAVAVALFFGLAVTAALFAVRRWRAGKAVSLDLLSGSRQSQGSPNSDFRAAGLDGTWS